MPQQSPWQIGLINSGIVLTAILISCIIAEGLCRIVLNPVDFLTPDLVFTERYGNRIQAGSAGHDNWGFRNYERPNQIDIVALGDSQTYGVSAQANASWPHQLSQLINQPIYNLGLIGGGPNEYRHLLEDYVTQLQPTTLIIGSYLGNDLLDAAPQSTGVDVVGDTASSTPRFHGLRKWLARHSILYKLLTYTVLEQVKFSLSKDTAADPALCSLVSENPAFQTRLTPQKRLRALDRNCEDVRAGYERMKTVFMEINNYCQANNIQLIVAIIPTKELVLAPFFPKDITHKESLTHLIADETFFRNDWRQFLNQLGITTIDTLPALRRKATHHLPYPGHQDGHPNHHGYSAIAKAIKPYLK